MPSPVTILAAAGGNPYTTAPAFIHPLPETLASLQQLANHPELVTIYPPADRYFGRNPGQPLGASA